MAALELTDAESIIMAGTDTALESAFAEGVSSGGSTIYAPMAGYTDFTEDLKGIVKGSYLQVLSALVRGLSPEWTPATLEGAWDDAAGFEETAYRLEGTRVFFKGTVTGGVSSTTIFTLPGGMRPAATVRLLAPSSGTAAVIEVTSDGKVSHRSGGTSEVSLDGLSFAI